MFHNPPPRPRTATPVPRRFAPLGLLAALASVIGAGCFAGSPGVADSSPGPGVRVLVYNIHAGKDADGVDNLARVEEVVAETGADLVLLQEVDRGTRRSGGVDQVAELARRTGFHGAFGRTLDYQGGGYGIAVLSRWPIRSDTLIPLPVTPPQERAGGSHEPRGVLRVVVDAPAGPIVVLDTHLDASGDDAYRRQEVAGVLRAAEADRARSGRVLVGGDFNSEPGSAPIAAMRDAGWRDAWATCGPRSNGDAVADRAAPSDGAGLTYPADAPVKRIDYLFLAPGLDCASAEVPATRASDHRPVRITLDLTP